MPKLKLQLAGRLREHILEGRFQPGERLPSLRQMAEEWGCSLSLANRVYGLLAREGLIVSRAGAGYWVLELPPLNAPSPAWPKIEEPTFANAFFNDMRQRIYRQGTVSFASNLPSASWMPTRPIRRILQDLVEDYQSHDSPQEWALGAPKLRHTVAHMAAHEGWSLEPEEILVTGTGYATALFLCLRAVTRPGDRVLVESPFSAELREILWSLELEPVEMPIHEGTGLKAESFKHFVQRFSPAASLLQPCLHYPTGATISEADRREIAAFSGGIGHPIVEFSGLRRLSFQKPPLPLKAFETEARNIMWCMGSASYVGSALNVGYCAPGRWHDLVLRHRLASVQTAPGLQQRALAAFLLSEHYTQHMNVLRRTLRHTAEQYRAELRRSFPHGTHFHAAPGGCVSWVSLPPPLTGKALQEAAAAEGIALMPGDYFEAGTNRFRHHLALHHSEPLDDMHREALRRVGELARQLLEL